MCFVYTYMDVDVHIEEENWRALCPLLLSAWSLRIGALSQHKQLGKENVRGQSRRVSTRHAGEKQLHHQLPGEWLRFSARPAPTTTPGPWPTPLPAPLLGFVKNPEAPALPGNRAPVSQVSQAVLTCVFQLVGFQCVLRLPYYSSLPRPREENRTDCFPSRFPGDNRSADELSAEGSKKWRDTDHGVNLEQVAFQKGSSFIWGHRSPPVNQILHLGEI